MTWESFWGSLCLSFLTCVMGIVTVATKKSAARTGELMWSMERASQGPEPPLTTGTLNPCCPHPHTPIPITHTNLSRDNQFRCKPSPKWTNFQISLLSKHSINVVFILNKQFLSSAKWNIPFIMKLRSHLSRVLSGINRLRGSQWRDNGSVYFH